MPTGIDIVDNSDADYVVGSDESGAGALAGPMLVCAVLAPKDWVAPEGLRDSKKLTDRQLESLYDIGINDEGIVVVIREISADYIDQIGKQRALIEAHEKVIREAIGFTHGAKTLAISDGNMKIDGAVSVPKADDLVPAVSMASVIAKVKRDRIMWDFSRKYPEYGFDLHHGYPSAMHKRALDTLGPCPIHRRSYAPVRAALKHQEEVEARRLTRIALSE